MSPSIAGTVSTTASVVTPLGEALHRLIADTAVRAGAEDDEHLEII